MVEWRSYTAYVAGSNPAPPTPTLLNLPAGKRATLGAAV